MDEGYEIRSFQDRDIESCRRLYTEGLLAGNIAPNDTGWDIDNIPLAYMGKPSDHFWVAATSDGEVVAMLGVQHHEHGVGEIRRLRVAPGHRRKGIGTALVETALRFCQQRGDVKVTLDTVIKKDEAVPLFERFHFRLHTSRQIGEKELLYFYVDLYSSEKKSKK